METLQRQAPGAANVAQAIVELLHQEQDALVDLHHHATDQLEALRERDVDRLEQATLHANEAVNTLDGLRQVRERKMRLLGRVLKLEHESASLEQLASALDGEVATWLLEARANVRQQARTTEQRCEELTFTLRYAVELGRDILQALHGVDDQSTTPVYTATGTSGHAAGPRSVVNQVG